MKKIYISGPMTGYPELNFPAFHAAAKQLREAGYEVINPVDLTTPAQEQDWETCMRVDLQGLTGADAIAVLPHWQDSKGATIEVYLGVVLGMPIVEASTMKEIDAKSYLNPSILLSFIQAS